MIKESTQQEDIKIKNIYAPNTSTHRYIKQLEQKGEMNLKKIICWNFNSQHFTVSIGQIIYTENQRRNFGLKQHYRQSGPARLL